MHTTVSRQLSFALAASLVLPGLASLPASAATGKAAPAKTIQISGENVVTIQRARTGNGSKPEFLSVTVLPGRAMEVFQIMAYVPGKGEIPILHSPSLEEAKQILDGPGNADGTKDFTMGGAFLVPFANRILGKLSDNNTKVSTEWNGQPLTLNANWAGKKPGAVRHAIHGLMLNAKAVDVKTSTDNGFQIVSGEVPSSHFDQPWFSKTDVHISVALSGEAVIATIHAKNVGDKPEPVGIGWHPYFNLPSGQRAQARLRVTGDLHTEVNNYDDVFPTGKLTPVKGTAYDFTGKTGKALDHLFLDDNWVNLKKDAEGHSFSEIIDPAAKYGIRITALSKHINTVQAYSPLDQSFIALEPQFNYNDPFGKEWKGRDTGMVTLQPGQSVTWKVKLELFVPKS
ncbi:MAG: aldose epimerase family protein [Acidobacteriaceae bacterium]